MAKNRIFLTPCHATGIEQNRIIQQFPFFLKSVFEHQYTANILQTIKSIDQSKPHWRH